jgi:hypothetical protein
VTRNSCLLAALALLFLACGGGKPTGEKPSDTKPSEPSAPKEYTREEFEKAVIGKRTAEVIMMFGQPAVSTGKPFRDKAPPEGNPKHPFFEGTFEYEKRNVKFVGDAWGGARVHFKAGVAERVEWK